jgi:ribosomal protein S18 acetylase RimI-like enzyme
VIIRELEPGDVAACERILRALPEWFGIEESLLQYVRNLSHLEAFVAEASEGVVGFVSLRTHNRFSVEIDAIAVRPDDHGRGVGRAMIKHVEGTLRSRAVEFLQAKTLGPSRPNEHYERTRGFYEHLGFRALEENHLWGAVNPCLIMVKFLGSSAPRVSSSP